MEGRLKRDHPLLNEISGKPSAVGDGEDHAAPKRCIIAKSG
jgi:hypothetical protein